MSKISFGYGGVPIAVLRPRYVMYVAINVPKNMQSEVRKSHISILRLLRPVLVGGWSECPCPSWLSCPAPCAVCTSIAVANVALLRPSPIRRARKTTRKWQLPAPGIRPRRRSESRRTRAECEDCGSECRRPGGRYRSLPGADSTTGSGDGYGLL